MDTTTLLIILIIVLLLGGGGWYGRGRWFQRIWRQLLSEAHHQMTERSKHRPRDPVQLAKLIGDIATGQIV